MRNGVLLVFAAGSVAFFGFVTTGFASSSELSEAVALMKQMHVDQCQLQELRGKVMLAHQNHDDDALNELWPQMETVTKRLKPSEEKLKLLKTSLSNNPDERSAFETALLEESECG